MLRASWSRCPLFIYLSDWLLVSIDLVKQKEQLGEDVTEVYDYSFSENGLVGYKNGTLIHQGSFVEHLGEAKLRKLIDWLLGYLSTMDIPIKRGTFIEYRKGMLNVSPIGRNCSREERNAFEKFDLENHARKTMVEKLEKEFGEATDYNLKFSIGGQISFDVFPKGWDKTYCLKFIEDGEYDEIHFFGDKTYPGGNDYELYHDKRVKGHAVKNWAETKDVCKELFFN